MTTATSQPPSRRDNPFATCWTRPGAIPYRFAEGESAEQLIDLLASRNWRGAIVGAHGSGKSTLLETLKPAITSMGRHVVAVSLHDGQRRLPVSAWSELERSTAPSDMTRCHGQTQVLIIDGYEQLSMFERWLVAQRCRHRRIGLFVTSHTPVYFPSRLPTLITTAPDRDLISRLVRDLTAEVSTNISFEDVNASHACHGSNVREIFFDLYDRHERRRLRG